MRLPPRSPDQPASCSPSCSSPHWSRCCLPRLATADEVPARVGVWPLQPAPDVVRAVRPARQPVGVRAPRGGPGRPAGQPVRAALAGRSASPAGSPGAAWWSSTTATTRTTYEPVAASVEGRRRGARRERARAARAVRLALLPARLPALGLGARARRYLDPLALVGGGPVRLLPLMAGLPGAALVAARLGAGRPAVAARLRRRRWRPLGRLAVAAACAAQARGWACW